MANMLKFMMENFAHVFPIVLAGALGLIIAVERFIAFIWVHQILTAKHLFLILPRAWVLVLPGRSWA